MSMFIHGKSHIDALIRFAGRAEIIPNGMSPTEAGKMLWQAELDSCHVRYPDTKDGGQYPGPMNFKGQETVDAYRYVVPKTNHSPDIIMAAAMSVKYQACETDAWEGSPAHALVKRIEKAARDAGASEGVQDGWDL